MGIIYNQLYYNNLKYNIHEYSYFSPPKLKIDLTSCLFLMIIFQ